MISTACSNCGADQCRCVIALRDARLLVFGVGSSVGAIESSDGRTDAPGLGDWLLP